jgi:hypothetical protein
MGKKVRKTKRKAEAAILRKTGGIPPVTLAVADPVSAFIHLIPTDNTTISLHRAFQKIVKDVATNRPKKGPLKKVKLQPKARILERLTLRKDENGKLIMDVLPGDPIATLDGKPFVRKKNLVEDEVVIGGGESSINISNIVALKEAWQ